jgi:hypothetical protein
MLKQNHVKQDLPAFMDTDIPISRKLLLFILAQKINCMSTRHINVEDKLVRNNYIIWGFHSMTVEELSLLGCHVVWLDNFFLSFWRNILPFSYEEPAPSCFIIVLEDFINLSGARLAICTLWFQWFAGIGLSLKLLYDLLYNKYYVYHMIPFN